MKSLVPPQKIQLNPVLLNRIQNRLRFKHLALLSALSNGVTLHLAAEELNISQPAATKLLKDLEETLDVLLFQRHARGLTPTPLGQAVIHYSKTVMGQMKHFTADLESKRQGGQGFLSVGAITGAVPDLVGPAIAEMKTKYPFMTIRVLGDTSDQIMQLLESHQIEFAVCRYIAAEQHSQFSFEPLGNEKLLFVASRNHAMARKKKLTLSDLMEETWVMQPLPSPTRIQLEHEFAKQNLPRPLRIIECSSVYASLQVLQKTQGVALISEPVVRDAINARKIAKLEVDHQAQLDEYGIVMRRGIDFSTPARQLAEQLRQIAFKL